jgi:predicted  nucleic acid-binding Zn-ribbon protein
MPVAAEQLRELHQLHQRARALRDRMTSAPKSLAARQAALSARRTELENAKKGLQNAKIELKKLEHSLQSIETKIDDLKLKLNQVKKNDEYKALQNQIAHDNAAKSKVEEDILLCYDTIESKTVSVAKFEDESKRSAQEVSALEQQISQQAATQQVQLQQIETALADAENALPEDSRDRYRRIVSRYGADALAACEDGACHGCFTALTPQMINDLINGDALSFCLSCGRLLYLAEREVSHTRRKSH